MPMAKKISIVKFIIVTTGMMLLTNSGTREIVPLVLSFFWMLADIKKEAISDKNVRICVGIFSTLCSVAVFMVNAEKIFYECYLIEGAIKSVFFVVAIVLVCNTFLTYVINKIGNAEFLFNRPVEKDVLKSFAYKSFIISFLVLVFWTLMDYPGDLSKDSIHVVGIARGDLPMIGAALPTSLVLLMRGCLRLTGICGLDANAAVFLYNAVQIFLISLAVAYLIYILGKIGIGRGYCYATIAYFIFIPYNVQFSHTLWKDVPFAYCCMLFMLLIWYQNLKDDVDRWIWIEYVLIVISGIGITTYRSNGYYAFLVFIPFSIFIFWKKRKDVIVVVFITWLISMIVRGPISDTIINSNNKAIESVNTEETMLETVAVGTEEDAFSDTVASEVVREDNIYREDSATEAEEQYIEQSGINKSYEATGIYIITCQQLAAVLMKQETISEEELGWLDEVFDIDLLKESYEQGISDNTLKSLDIGSSERYLEIWKELGLRYPEIYLMAWKDMTCGYWYPEVDERWVFVDEMAYNEYGIYKTLPVWFTNIREQVERLYLRIPVYGLLFSIGGCVWLTSFCCMLTVVKKGWKSALCYLPIVGVWLTLLVATPVYAEFRYLYCYFVCLPISLLIPWVEKR